jgi:ankyrin repeat protein
MSGENRNLKNRIGQNQWKARHTAEKLFLGSTYDVGIRGAGINAKNKDSFSPLYMAARSGNKFVTKLLLAHGADVNSKDSNGMTPLHEALMGPQELRKDVVELLRQHGGLE